MANSILEISTADFSNLANSSSYWPPEGSFILGIDVADKKLKSLDSYGVVYDFAKDVPANGLTQNANHVELGGTLSKATYIDINTNSFNFFDGERFIVDFKNSTLYNAHGIASINWNSRTLYSQGNTVAASWGYTLQTAIAPEANDDVVNKLYADSKVPQTRTISINGSTLDLTADVDFNISSLPDFTGNTGKFLSNDGTDAVWSDINLTGFIPLPGTDTLSPITGDLRVDNTFSRYFGAYTDVDNYSYLNIEEGVGVSLRNRFNGDPESYLQVRAGFLMSLSNEIFLTANNNTFFVSNGSIGFQSSTGVSVSNVGAGLLLDAPNGMIIPTKSDELEYYAQGGLMFFNSTTQKYRGMIDETLVDFATTKDLFTLCPNIVTLDSWSYTANYGDSVYVDTDAAADNCNIILPSTTVDGGLVYVKNLANPSTYTVSVSSFVLQNGEWLLLRMGKFNSWEIISSSLSDLPLSGNSNHAISSAGLFSSLLNKEDLANKVSTIVGNEADTTKYSSTKAVADYISYFDTNTLIPRFALKANLNSPSLTGVPRAPTAVTGGAESNTNQIATTEFVTSAIGAIPTPPTPTLATVTTAGNITTNDITVGSVTASNTTVNTLPFIDATKKIISATGALFGTWLNGLTAKSTPIGADTIVINDSASSFEAKKTTLTELWTNYLRAFVFATSLNTNRFLKWDGSKLVDSLLSEVSNEVIYDVSGNNAKALLSTTANNSMFSLFSTTNRIKFFTYAGTTLYSELIATVSGTTIDTTGNAFVRMRSGGQDSKQIYVDSSMNYYANTTHRFVNQAGIVVSILTVDGLALGSATINASVQLDLQSTTKGIGLNLVPTASLPTASTRKGNLLFDSTTNNIKWSDGTNWITPLAAPTLGTNYIPKWSASLFTNSNIQDNNTTINLGIKTAIGTGAGNPLATLDLQSTTLGLGLSLVAGDVVGATGRNGLLWYDTTNHLFKGTQNGNTVNLLSGSGLTTDYVSKWDGTKYVDSKLKDTATGFISTGITGGFDLQGLSGKRIFLDLATPQLYMAGVGQNIILADSSGTTKVSFTTASNSASIYASVASFGVGISPTHRTIYDTSANQVEVIAGSNGTITWTTSGGVQTAKLNTSGLTLGTATINASSQLELQSTTKGLGLNQVAGDLGTTRNGLVWYDTTNNLFKGTQNGSTVSLLSGSGLTNNRLTKWNDSSLINSLLIDDGTGISIGTRGTNSLFDLGNTTVDAGALPTLHSRPYPRSISSVGPAGTNASVPHGSIVYWNNGANGDGLYIYRKYGASEGWKQIIDVGTVFTNINQTNPDIGLGLATMSASNSTLPTLTASGTNQIGYISAGGVRGLRLSGGGNAFVRHFEGDSWYSIGYTLRDWDNQIIGTVGNGGRGAGCSFSSSIAPIKSATSTTLHVVGTTDSNSPYYSIEYIVKIDTTGNPTSLIITKPSSDPSAYTVGITGGKIVYSGTVPSNGFSVGYSFVRSVNYGLYGHLYTNYQENERYSADATVKYWAGSGGLALGSSTINGSAQLELQSTTKGFLPPRMTTAQKEAIADVEGLVVYDTDLNSLCVNDGVSWTTLGGGSGGGGTNVSTKTANYTINSANDIILADATSGVITITLPSAVGVTKPYKIKRISTNSNVVTVNTTSSQTMDGSTTLNLVAYQSLEFVSDGANWFIV